MCQMNVYYYIYNKKVLYIIEISASLTNRMLVICYVILNLSMIRTEQELNNVEILLGHCIIFKYQVFFGGKKLWVLVQSYFIELI